MKKIPIKRFLYDANLILKPVTELFNQDSRTVHSIPHNGSSRLSQRYLRYFSSLWCFKRYEYAFDLFMVLLRLIWANWYIADATICQRNQVLFLFFHKALGWLVINPLIKAIEPFSARFKLIRIVYFRICLFWSCFRSWRSSARIFLRSILPPLYQLCTKLWASVSPHKSEMWLSSHTRQHERPPLLLEPPDHQEHLNG